MLPCKQAHPSRDLHMHMMPENVTELKGSEGSWTINLRTKGTIVYSTSLNTVTGDTDSSRWSLLDKTSR